MTSQGFNKYQGAGNDFIIIDNRDGKFISNDHRFISKLCDRRFGIGADGLILVAKHPNLDYEMKYFNADGKIGTMCGNGGRCVSAFAYRHGIAGREQKFLASDGIHASTVNDGSISLKMSDIHDFKIVNDGFFIDTGSPHYVVFKDQIDDLDVFNEGKRLRWSKEFAPGGTNVDFVQVCKDELYVRTFERGVEDETYACGTGVTASAIIATISRHFGSTPVPIRTRGGDMSVDFMVQGEREITDIWLTGPAEFVFEGTINV